VNLDSVQPIEEQPEQRSELRFRAGVAVLIAVAVVLLLISLGLVQLVY